MNATSAVLGLVLLAACTGPSPRAQRVDVDGTIQYVELEGGFWAIRGDDAVTYDPVSFPPDYRKDGLRVHAVLDRRDDLGSAHAVGPIVEVIALVLLPCGPVPCPPPPPAVQLKLLDGRGLGIEQAALASVSGPPGSGASSCETFSDPGSAIRTAHCFIFGNFGTGAGPYEADVIAPGYESMHVRVDVSAREPLPDECCPVTYVPERQVLALSPQP